ncbi:MAG: hypothetical protein ACLR02_12170 [Clostridium sp.]
MTNDDITIFDNVNKLLKDVQIKLITNQELIKLLKYDNDTPLDNKDLTIDEAWDLTKPQTDTKGKLSHARLNFCPIALGVVTEVSSLVAMTFEVNTISSKPSFCNIYMGFIILVKSEVFDLADGSNRMLNIASAITKAMQNYDKGVGQITLDSFETTTPPNGYSATKLFFKVSDFK